MANPSVTCNSIRESVAPDSVEGRLSLVATQLAPDSRTPSEHELLVVPSRWSRKLWRDRSSRPCEHPRRWITDILESRRQLAGCALVNSLASSLALFNRSRIAPMSGEIRRLSQASGGVTGMVTIVAKFAGSVRRLGQPAAACRRGASGSRNHKLAAPDRPDHEGPAKPSWPALVRSPRGWIASMASLTLDRRLPDLFQIEGSSEAPPSPIRFDSIRQRWCGVGRGERKTRLSSSPRGDRGRWRVLRSIPRAPPAEIGIDEDDRIFSPASRWRGPSPEVTGECPRRHRVSRRPSFGRKYQKRRDVRSGDTDHPENPACCVQCRTPSYL
jgi:hypothetical protein